MKKSLVFLYTLFVISSAYAQTEPLNYAAVLNKFKTFYNNNKPDSIYKMFGPEMTSMVSVAQLGQLKNQLGVLNQLTFTGYRAPIASYDAAFQNGSLILNLSLNNANMISGLGLTPAVVKTVASTLPDDPSLTETPISTKILGGTLSGTLTMPKSPTGKIPVVLIIAGSGPTDRDGNSTAGVNGNTYKMMAIALGKSGIASLRYDKRMIGKSVSTIKEKDLRFDDYADDAIQLVKLLHDDARFSKIIVLGHSEGSLIGILASTDEPVNGYISVAGVGERIDKTLTTQLKDQPDFVKNGFKSILDSLKKGKFTDKVDPSLYALMRPSVQPYMLSWLRHDPALEIKAIRVPVLIIQGTTDIQVSVDNAEKLKKAKSDATLLIIPGMNHMLKEAPADRAANIATYNNPTLPLKPELMTGIIGFINKLK